MAKDSFQFREFTIHQRLSAMKVGTDGVLLGAWSLAPTANPSGSSGYPGYPGYPGLSSDPSAPASPVLSAAPSRILDIGTGTGLIALMLAQRYPDSLITAIDISPEAVLEARANVAASPFSARIQVLESDITTFTPSGSSGTSVPSGTPGYPGISGTPGKPGSLASSPLFTAIACNPPYFIDSLASPDARRTLARHTASLTYAQLIASCWRLLSPDGRLSLIIPADCRSRLEAEARLRGFFLTRLCAVKTTPQKPPKRYLMEFRKQPTTEPDITEAVLETSPGERSPWYRRLTADFYIR